MLIKLIHINWWFAHFIAEFNNNLLSLTWSRAIRFRLNSAIITYLIITELIQINVINFLHSTIGLNCNEIDLIIYDLFHANWFRDWTDWTTAWTQIYLINRYELKPYVRYSTQCIHAIPPYSHTAQFILTESTSMDTVYAYVQCADANLKLPARSFGNFSFWYPETDFNSLHPKVSSSEGI